MVAGNNQILHSHKQHKLALGCGTRKTHTMVHKSTQTGSLPWVQCSSKAENTISTCMTASELYPLDMSVMAALNHSFPLCISGNILIYYI